MALHKFVSVGQEIVFDLTDIAPGANRQILIRPVDRAGRQALFSIAADRSIAISAIAAAQFDDERRNGKNTVESIKDLEPRDLLIFDCSDMNSGVESVSMALMQKAGAKIKVRITTDRSVKALICKR